MDKKALITGITGQDGSYLAELLLALGYEVHGLIRRASNFNTQRIDHLYKDPHTDNLKLHLHYADLSDSSRLTTLLAQIRPDEIYNLAAQSHVRVSFDEPEYTGDTTGLGSIRLLEAMRQACPQARFYQASSSEMFGSSAAPQSEATAFSPRSPYGIAKLYSHWSTRNYRESYGLFAVSGILFNHESPRRGETFVTRKITRAVARISKGEQSELYLGNLSAKRDWGYAPEYVIAMWKMLQSDNPSDYVIGTGTEMSVQDFVESAFSKAGLNWKDYVRFDDKYLRPSEVDHLVADPALARTDLNWEPSIQGDALVEVMLQHDLAIMDGQVVDNPIGKLWKETIS
jgi:GDPmannose 4,6-dehydratase